LLCPACSPESADPPCCAGQAARRIPRQFRRHRRADLDAIGLAITSANAMCAPSSWRVRLADPDGVCRQVYSADHRLLQSTTATWTVRSRALKLVAGVDFGGLEFSVGHAQALRNAARGRSRRPAPRSVRPPVRSGRIPDSSRDPCSEANPDERQRAHQVHGSAGVGVCAHQPRRVMLAHCGIRGESR